MTFTKLAVGFIVRFREHRDSRGHLLGGPFVHVGRVDHGGLRRSLAGGGFRVGLVKRNGHDGGWYGLAVKYREWFGPRENRDRAELAAAVRLRETLLDIGADHEGHTLTVSRMDDDDELGPGHWALLCESDDGVPVLDFALIEGEKGADHAD